MSTVDGLKWKASPFCNLAKSFKDLWKTNFDFKNEVKVVNRTQHLEVTTGFSGCNGSVGVKINEPKMVVDGDLDVAGKLYGKATFMDLYPSTKLILGLGTDPTSCDRICKDNLSLKAEVEHCDEAWTAGLAVTGAMDKDFNNVGKHLTVSGSVGVDKLTVGGQMKYNLDTLDAMDYNFGMAYDIEGWKFAATTEEQTQVMKLSGYFNRSLTQKFGVECVSDEYDRLSKPSETNRRVMNFVHEYAFNNQTTGKIRGSTTGVVAGSLQHRMPDPRMKINLSAQWKLKDAAACGVTKAEKVGVALTFGDC